MRVQVLGARARVQRTRPLAALMLERREQREQSEARDVSMRARKRGMRGERTRCIYSSGSAHSRATRLRTNSALLRLCVVSLRFSLFLFSPLCTQAATFSFSRTGERERAEDLRSRASPARGARIDLSPGAKRTGRDCWPRGPLCPSKRGINSVLEKRRSSRMRNKRSRARVGCVGCVETEAVK